MRYFHIQAAPVALVLASLAAAANADSVTPDPLTNGTAALASAAAWATTGPGQSPPATIAGNPNGASGTGVYVNDLTANTAGNYTFTDSYSGSTAVNSGLTIAPPGGSAQSIGFVDSYVIAVPSASSNAFAFSLSLSSTSGLSNLSLRLYQYASGTYPSLTAVNPNIVYGTVSPANGLIDAWSVNSVQGSADTTSLPIIDLQTGEYVLQIAGISNGTTGGTYNGQLEVQPVPLPAALPLLLSGLGGLGLLGRRRKSTAG
jgi:hypothetical protein